MLHTGLDDPDGINPVSDVCRALVAYPPHTRPFIQYLCKYLVGVQMRLQEGPRIGHEVGVSEPAKKPS
ncbi:hypothetical protein D9M68_785280 [compost metagenome]